MGLFDGTFTSLSNAASAFQDVAPLQTVVSGISSVNQQINTAVMGVNGIPGQVGASVSNSTSFLGNAASAALGAIAAAGTQSLVNEAWQVLSDAIDPASARISSSGASASANAGKATVYRFTSAGAGGANGLGGMGGGATPSWAVTITGPAVGGVGKVTFPYLPSVTSSFKANYSAQRLTHNNYGSYAYESSEVSEIQITGDFSVQTDAEAAALMGAVAFFRAATKMFYGADGNAGCPPPLVKLNGYNGYFNNVLCAVTNFSHSLPPEVDYAGSAEKLPTLSSLTVTLQPVYSRQYVASSFSHAAVAGGNSDFI